MDENYNKKVKARTPFNLSLLKSRFWKYLISN